MCVYNGQRFVRAAIDSILSQTLQDLELIVVDDCSSDSTAEILAGYRDARIRLTRTAKNSGPTRSANQGLSLAKGEYVARIDSDDVALPHRLEKQVEVLRNNAAGLAHSNVTYIDANDQVLGGSERDFEPYLTHWRLLFDGYLFHPTFMWNRKRAEKEVGGYDEKFPIALDFDYSWRAMKAMGLIGIQEPLVRYRVHGENITAQKRATQQSIASEASFSHLAQEFGLRIEEAKELFLGVRELAIFKSPADWTPERIDQVLPRYLECWKRFLTHHDLMSWQSRPRGLKDLAIKDLINATGILIAARDIVRLRQAFTEIHASGVVPGPQLMRSILLHRFREKVGRPTAESHPTW
jgi:glycosyltransferase involved in cell wall biosynthesis